MFDDQLGDDFLTTSDQYQLGSPAIGHIETAQHPAAAFEQSSGLFAGLFLCRWPNDRLIGNPAPAIIIGRADFECIGRRIASGAHHPDSVWADLLQRDGREIDGYIGHEVGLRIAHFIKQLLGHRADAYQPAGVVRLGYDAASIREALRDGRADGGPTFDLMPIGKRPARRLRAAFDQMSGHRPASQLGKVCRNPAEFMDQWPKCKCAIDHASGDDDVSALL